MDYLTVPPQNKKKHGGLLAKIIILLLVCILAVLVYGLFFYDGGFDETNAIVSENTELKKELAEKELMIEELNGKLNTSSATAEPSPSEDIPLEDD